MYKDNKSEDINTYRIILQFVVSVVFILTLRRATSEPSTVGIGGLYAPPLRSQDWKVTGTSPLDHK